MVLKLQVWFLSSDVSTPSEFKLKQKKARFMCVVCKVDAHTDINKECSISVLLYIMELYEILHMLQHFYSHYFIFCMPNYAYNLYFNDFYKLKIKITWTETRQYILILVLLCVFSLMLQMNCLWFKKSDFITGNLAEVLLLSHSFCSVSHSWSTCEGSG